MSDDINKLIPQRVTMTVLRTINADQDNEQVIEETVVVRHQRMGDLPQLFKDLAPLQGLIVAIKDSAKDKTDKPKITPMSIVMGHTDSAMQLIATCMHKDKAWVASLEISSTVELFTKLLEVNLNFFIQRVLPSVVPALSHLTAALNSSEFPGGQKTSRLSSEQDTAITSV